MKVVIAPDSYKDCASALNIASYIKEGFSQVFDNVEYKKYIMADGGEGFVDSMVDATGGEKVYINSLDPLLREVKAYIALSNDKSTAFIEMAQSSGLELLNIEERNPLNTSTYGTGIMIKHAISLGVKRIIIGIGGSATCDAGIGMAEALGVKFYNGDTLLNHVCGRSLDEITKIDTSGIIDLKDVVIDVACDVDNPLFGSSGASFIYNKQKGADKRTIEIMDGYLRDFSTKFDREGINTKAGSGAAGGLGFGLMYFLGGELKPGVDIILDYINIEEDIKDCDLVITGEGMTDHQSVMGKAPIGVAKLAKSYNKPVFMLSAAYGKDYTEVYNHGVSASFSPIKSIISLEESINSIKPNLIIEARNLAMAIKVGMSLDK